MSRPNWSPSRVLTAAVATVTLLAVLCGLVVDRTAAVGRLDQVQESCDDHERRLRAVEGRLGEIRTDVRWIRRALEADPYTPSR